MEHDSAQVEPLLEAATRYVRRGWAITPLHGFRDGMCTCHKSMQCKSIGKHPVWGEWPDRPITMPEQVQAFFGVQFPYANVGIVTGPASGLWVLDIDPKNGGDIALASLVESMGALPRTYTVRTGSGGLHHYWAMPPDFVPGGSPGRLPAGLDVRGLGGQVVAPPSVSGVGPYTVELDIPIAPAPGWLLDLIRPIAYERTVAATSGGVGGAQPVTSGGALDLGVSPPPTDLARGRRYALAAIGDELAKLRAESPGHRGGTAVRAAYAIIELINSPWAALGGYEDQIRAAYDAAATEAAERGGEFDLKEAGECWRSAERKIGTRGRPEPAELDYGGGEPVLLPWSEVPSPFDPAEAARIMSGDVSTPVAAAVAADQYAGDVLKEAHRQRVRVAAREIVDAEVHAAGWTAPESFGPLTSELMMPEPLAQWRIKGLLGLGHNALVVAKRKVGKTTLTNELIRCLADGGDFLGRFKVVPPDGTIAVFNYEVEPSQYRRWMREVGITATDRVHVLHLRGKSLPLSNPRVRAWTAAWLRERDVKVWIPDPYSQAYVGSVNNGNDEAEVGKFLNLLDQVKESAGISELIMPTHSGKGRAEPGEESAIGSQRLEGWPDSMWYLTKDEISGDRFLRAEGRDVEVGQEQLRFDQPTRRLTMGGWDQREAGRRRQINAIHDFVTKNPGCSMNDLSGAVCKGNKANARVWTDMAIAAKKIYMEQGSNRAQKHYPEPGATKYA